MNKNNAEKICVECGNPFTPKNARQVVCSPTCSENRHRKQNKKYSEAKAIIKHRVCIVCGKEFETKHGTKLTCSKECSDIYHKNQVMEWHKTNKGKTYSRPKPKRTPTSNREALVEDAKKARELGISYGMYVAMNR